MFIYNCLIFLHLNLNGNFYDVMNFVIVTKLLNKFRCKPVFLTIIILGYNSIQLGDFI